MTERFAPATDLDGLFEALADPERRRLLYYLREHGDATTTELADVVTGWLAADRGVGRTSPADREAVGTRLRDRHLQTLVEAGLVTVDDATDVVSIAALPPHVDHLCDAAFAAETARPVVSDAPANHESDRNHANDHR